MAKRDREPQQPASGEFSLREAIQIAQSHHRSGNFRKAQDLYGQILIQFPDSPDALNFLGVLRHQMGASDEGANFIRRAVAISAEYADAWNNLGNVLVSMGGEDEAAKAYRKVVRLVGEHADALNNLALIHKRQKDYERSEKYFRRALDANPSHPETHRNLGNLLLLRGETEEAYRLYRRGIELQPDNGRHYRALGRAYRISGNIEGAILLYREWLDYDPDSATAKHQLAALTGDAVPDRASVEYVKEEFDGFAESFDRVLERLHYRAPELCREAVDTALPGAAGTLSVLDAGCGTGLCGTFLKPYARRLVGVDLSSKMIDQAEKTGHYDELEAADLLEWLPGAGPFDLVVSADTFCYFGDLDPLVGDIAGTLAPKGVLIFTVEQGEEDGPAFEIQRHGRYRHSRSGIVTTIAAAGLEERGIESCALRMEGGDQVRGFLVTAARPGV